MKDIYCLAIESSCDETSMSIIKNGTEEICTVTNTQIDIHKEFGGVVPEVASRSHIENRVVNITLEVRKSNKIAIHLYKKFGFREVAIRKYYYGDEDGILMEKQVM